MMNGSTAEEKNGKKEEKSKDANSEHASNQGDFHVWLQGKATLKDKHITVKGTSNLLPGARLTFRLHAVEGVIIGGSKVAIVGEDGTFSLETNIPNNYDYPVIFAELTFQPEHEDEDIQAHYTPSDKKLKGPFVRLYEEDEELKKQISVHLQLEQKDGGVTVPIEAPKWKKPQDYGSPKVWIETEVREDDEFIYIDGKSNLLEGSYLSGSIDIPGYISFGFSDHVFTNPDGSFRMTIKHPKTKIDNISEYGLDIHFRPSDGNSYRYIFETYGEQGEKLQGELVKKEDLETIIAYTKKISAE